VDVVLGVNGYVWVSKKSVLETSRNESADRVSITRLEEEASEAIYSDKNEYISPATRREIARIGNCIKAMVRYNVRVDEDMLNAVYEAAVGESETGDDAADGSLEGEVGRRVVEKGMAARMGLM
jgi:exosome complex component RRP4